MFLTADLLLITKASSGNACGADCGAAGGHSKKKSPFLLFYFSLLLILFSFASSDVGYFFVAQFHSIDVPR